MISLDAAEWEYIGVEGREVIIAFDGDAISKPDVRQYERELWEFLVELGAHVKIAALPPNMGLDDYLASGRTIAELKERVTGYSRARPA